MADAAGQTSAGQPHSKWGDSSWSADLTNRMKAADDTPTLKPTREGWAYSLFFYLRRFFSLFYISPLTRFSLALAILLPIWFASSAAPFS